MKKSAFALSLLVVLGAALMSGASGFQKSKPRIAVLEFTAPFTESNPEKQKASLSAQNGLIEELMKAGKFRVVQREPLLATLRRENLPLSGDIDKATAVKIGKLLGVNYVATGAVTEYGVTDKGAHSHGTPSYSVAIKLSLIDTSTGEVKWTEEARNVGAPALGRGPIMDRVIKPCIQKLTASLKAADL